MPSPFDSAYLKLAWGRKHIDQLEREIGKFLEQPPFESFTEPHPHKPEHIVQKMRLSRPIPEQFAMISGDAVDNLRAALDHAVYAVAVAAAPSGKRIEHANFPFAGTAAHFENKLKGSKDIPKEFWPLLRSFKPYKGGNELLVALNQACNHNKHALIISCIGISKIAGVDMQSSVGYISVPTRHVWDRTKNEMELFTEEIGAQRKGHFDFQFLVIFTGIVEDVQAFTVLAAFAAEVEQILNAIEAEARHLGFCQ